MADAAAPSTAPAPPPGPTRADVAALGLPWRVPVGDGRLYVMETTGPEGLTPDRMRQVRRVHAASFPDEVAPDAPDAEWLDRVTFCHDPADCLWFFLWRQPAARTGRPTLVALATAVPYATSLFGFNLAVLPDLRKRGLGRRVMHGIQAAALALGTSAISATVDGAAPALVRYYCSHGGVVEASGVTAPGAPPPPTVRVVKKFDAAELAAVTAAADAAVGALHSQAAVVRGFSVAGAVAGVAALAAFLLAA